MAVCGACGRENPEDARFCNGCGAPLSAEQPAREMRKTVTVLFSDVTSSTALGERHDPESLRRVMSRWFELARRTLERHGASVEKFVGDAVMAVFGIPSVHEDDALRAVRAAAELRSGLAVLNAELERDFGIRLETRTGINTGEVVAGEGETLATGDAVNVAARLEQAAAPGETLLGEGTIRLVRDAVVVEPVEPLSLKGKSEAVPAHRLVDVLADAPGVGRRLDAPLVGRESELAQLRQAFDRCVRERTAMLFTLLGPAGIGKSRLAEELLAEVRSSAAVLSSRCLPYGEGITYWPLLELLRESVHDDVRERVAELLAGEQQGELIADRLAASIGAGTGAADEIAWAARKLFEHLARERPLVLVLDDLHWAEPTFLDLVDHVADLSRDAPILLLCLSRPELLEARPGWGGGKLNAASLLLEPLSDAESGELLERLLAGSALAPEVLRRIADAAEGNPLFVEQMLGLVRKELIRPDRSSFVGDEAFRFRHLLIRDAAYESLPKQERADLHERFAGWLERAAGERAGEYEEILGYHLEQAYRYRLELGPIDDAERSLGRRAASLLASSGRAALDRRDIRAATTLLSRAADILRAEDGEYVPTLHDLADALWDAGEATRAERLVMEALGYAERDGNHRLAARLQVLRLQIVELTGADVILRDTLKEAERLAQELEDLGDNAGLLRALTVVARTHFFLGSAAEAKRIFDRALSLVPSADERRPSDETDARAWRLGAIRYGPTSVEAGIRACEEALAGPLDARVECFALSTLGTFKAMRRQFEAARALCERAKRIADEFGHRLRRGAHSMMFADVELHAGDLDAAERELRGGYEILRSLGELGYRSTVASMLADLLAKQGRDAEAERLVAEVIEIATADDFDPQARWRATKARLLARSGEHEQAEVLAREAVTLVMKTDYLPSQAEMHAALADVLAAAGRYEEAVEAAAVAGAALERKGDVVGAELARGRLAELRAAAGVLPGDAGTIAAT